MKLYGDIQSGNCYKVYLLCRLLDIPLDWQTIDILAGHTKTSEFLAINPNGKIPVLQLSDNRVLTESNAILLFLASNTDFLPENHWQKAKVFEWLFFEQYSHEPFIATNRFIQKYLGLPEDKKELYLSQQPNGYKALSIMENQLQKTPFLIGEQYTIADIALYAYTHVADEGGFDLSAYPAILRWIQRIESYPNHVSIPQLIN